MSKRDEVARTALALSPEDRAWVLESIERSLLSDPECLTGAELLAELERRSAAYRAGTTTAHSAEEVLAELRARQARRRQNSTDRRE